MARYHVKIAGQGFLIRPGSYRRSATTPYSGEDGSPGWRRWTQSGWRGGEGQLAWGGGASPATQGGDGWRAGYGVEIAGSGALGLGSALATSFASQEGGFAAMLAFRGRLYAASASSGKIYGYDGAAWAMDHDTGKGSLASLARFGDSLYAGSGSDGWVFRRDGSGWAPAFQMEGAAAVTAMAAYGLWDSTAGATVSRLFLGCSFPEGEARVYRWDGTAAVEVHRCGEARVEAMALYRGRLYLATSDSGNGVQGRILSFDGRSASGEWAEEVWIPDSYVAGWAVFDNLLFCGSGRGGRIWAFDGEEMAEAHRLTWAGQGYEPPVRALGVWGGRLYAGCLHPTEGTALIGKLPAAMLGLPGRTGDAMGLSRRGWCTPCAAGPGGNARAMAAYGGCLYLAGEAVGAAAVYRKEPAAFRAGGVVETSSFDGGHPTTPKLLRSLSLTHGRLGPGQFLEVSFALEGSDSFQHVEGFDSLAGRDAALSTADWRPAGSLVRLRGMPALGFAGKREGDPRVPHTAHRLASGSPSSPPAEFVEELGDADYSALASVGDGVALASNPAPGGYAHLLFQFDLAGLSPAGLRPRAVCHGLGDWFDAATPGVMLRIWNHFTSSWSLLGSHQAPAGADPAARTLEAEIEGWEPYAGPSGRVYLSLISSYAGSPAAPSEVGADLVEMAPFWAAEGEAVSRSIRLPSTQPVSSAALTLLESGIPAGTGIGLFMSADGGGHWEEVVDGVEHAFANPGGSLRWKARLTSTGGLDTPTIGRLKVDYQAGEWIPLGRSDTEGSTGAAFPFPQGVEAGRVAFRVKLAATDPASSPALEGLSLEYALRAETRRRWEMELLCEGTAALPLRLLDGSSEARTGRELSELLWQAREAGPVEMEEPDGTRRQVWVEGLEEVLSGGDLPAGAQTVARCVLVES